MKKTFYYIYFILCFTGVGSSVAHAKTNESDSLKQKFAITDPRNPDCPCHKYQAMAEKEFKKLLKKQAAPVLVTSVNPAVSSRSNTARRRTYFFTSRKSSGKIKQAKQLRRSSAKRKKAGRRRSIVDACKKW